MLQEAAGGSLKIRESENNVQGKKKTSRKTYLI